MIVRINPIDITRAEHESGWPVEPFVGGLAAAWPPAVRAYELTIPPQDEKGRPLTDEFRRQQMRQMIPQAAIALRGLEDVPVLRFDGRMAGRELFPAWRHLPADDDAGRFAYSAAGKLEESAVHPAASVRLSGDLRRISAAVNDAAIGMERTVRCRLFFAPPSAAASLIDVSDTGDARWPGLLAESKLMIGTTSGLRSLHLFSAEHDLTQVRTKVMQRLIAVAKGQPAIP